MSAGASTPGVFEALLGDALEVLPPTVRRLHREGERRVYRGSATVTRGSSWLSRVAGTLTGLPPAAEAAPLEVTIEPIRTGERWIRRFGAHTMSSTLRASGGLLRERLGPNDFGFEVQGDAGGIRWILRSVRTLGVPLPLAWFRGVAAREFEEDGRYRFTVDAAMPVVGPLIRYDGWLELV